MATAVASSGLDNDTRGWIMCVVSGIACVVGASIVCVDVIVRLFPGKKNFRIQDSNVFLACSLSLSFGVMLFSALYSMLPESKDYFKQAKWSQQAAGLVMMACFVGGFIGIQGVSRILHQFMPTHVVECDHSHDDNANANKDTSCQHERRQSRATRRQSSRPRSSQAPIDKSLSGLANGHTHNAATESTPLLESTLDSPTSPLKRQASARDDLRRPASPTRSRTTTVLSDAFPERRKSMREVHKRVMSFVQDTKCNCDESNSCYGFSDPCGQECFKHLSSRTSLPSRPGRQAQILRTTTGSFLGRGHENSHAPHHDHHHDHECEESIEPFVRPTYRTSRAKSREPLDPIVPEEDPEHDSSCSSVSGDEDVEAQHHHHVPTNAFLSIGLQTSIAIALHKFPEGFITYATNHVNPSLGFNVFMALFVHNITEGFAMCLPLYMALGSRWRAMAWSAFLGGLSQPIGAGIAALWFKVADRTNMQPSAVAYACLFAVTSGIMVSVALQLFVESLSLNHSRNLCIFFGFLGMALLGFSNALVGSH
ncbi:ZIP zinc transporter-domain-containing protein [Fusarium flagelliforme]|uniref:Vacuolar zinc efflux protein n=1 Tax=Fusarium flagelliforme TaxID=2675880 RepID=A0A395MC05_9HYPO|nr:ZIP zinc transporter-domain-containing protein [Fusarium flagelliforme]KAH7188350.1 ZIP zinc transporter-domain-containing protein [Fusarium flagelliforme]RFN45398.1 vacuolar zinc efflux protein [Fusarium flagelliforme]